MEDKTEYVKLSATVVVNFDDIFKNEDTKSTEDKEVTEEGN